jgi:primosomal protein N''
MADNMPQLVRQLNQQMSLLEKENQRLQQELVLIQVQLHRCLKIIETMSKSSPQ